MEGYDAGNVRLVGRADELAQLVTTSQSLSGGVVLVIGPAGIGKTALLHTFGDAARRQGHILGWGVAGEWEAMPALWPWRQAFNDIDADQTVLRSTDDSPPSPPDMADQFQAVARWLRQLGATAPVLIVLEDLHDADPTTLALFSYLARRPALPGVTVVGSSRPGTPEVEAFRCSRIVLGGLSPTEIAELGSSLNHQIGERQANELAQRTNGNPLFVQRVLETNGAGDDSAVPSDVAALLHQQLQDAPSQAKEALRALAVLGSAPLDMIQRMSGTSGASALHLVSTEILSIADRSGIGTGFESIASFRHGLIREVLYQSLDAEERFELHARAADVLRSVGASPIALAHHLSRAAITHRGPDAAAAARQAAHLERSAGAIREAIHHAGLAVEILRELDDPDELADALIEEAEALALFGRAVEAEDRLREVADSADEHSTQRSHLLVRAYARLRWLEEPNPSALNAFDLTTMATQLLSPSSSLADSAIFHTAIATAGDIRGAGLQDIDAATKAVEAAAQTGDPTLMAEAHLARRRALSVHPLRTAERRTDADTALGLGNDVGDRELVIRAKRLALTDALAAGDRERVMVLMSSDPVSIAGRVQQALAGATMAALEGRYVDADDMLDDTLKELGYLDIAAPALEFSRIAYSWDRGQLPQTLVEFEPLLPVVADPALRAAVALAKMLTGQHEVAATLVNETLETLQSGGPTVLWSLSMLMLAETAAVIDHPAVPQMYKLLTPLAWECAVSATSPAAWCGSFDRVLGLLALRLGQPAVAADHLRTSVVIHERMGAVPWLARSRAGLAMALEQLGQSDEATSLRAAASDAAASIGMPDGVLMPMRMDVASLDSVNRSADPTQVEATLVRDGDVWRVGAGRSSQVLRHSKGLAYLHMLITHPSKDWHALDLYWTASETTGVVESGVGPMLDNQARAAYQARYVELSVTLEEATSNADLGRADAAQHEIDSLERELLAAFGLGGRARPIHDSGEKARINVRRAISRSIERLGEGSPTLASHLDRCIRTGRFCRYDPGPSPRYHWVTG